MILLQQPSVQVMKHACCSYAVTILFCHAAGQAKIIQFRPYVLIMLPIPEPMLPTLSMYVVCQDGVRVFQCLQKWQQAVELQTHRLPLWHPPQLQGVVLLHISLLQCLTCPQTSMWKRPGMPTSCLTQHNIYHTDTLLKTLVRRLGERWSIGKALKSILFCSQ